MITPKQASQLAEDAIVRYVDECIPDLDEREVLNLCRVLEMLMSKAALAIEKHCGSELAVEIARRTTFNLMGRAQLAATPIEGKPQ